MYDELVKRLREHNGWALNETLDEAADAIEELSKRMGESIPKSDAEIIIEELSKPRWIPVSERLPEKAGHYIVFVELKRNGQKISAWTQVTWFFGDFLLECPEDEERFVAAVTHWQPLPEPPKEEE